MSFIAKRLKQYGANSSGIAYIQFHFECDTQSDLPTQTQFQVSDGFIVAMGSTAHTIANNKRWEMNSSGTWVDMTNAPSTYDASDIIYDNTESGMTAINVQDAIDETHALDETQDRALAELYAADAKNQVLFQELVDNGSKNIVDLSKTTFTTNTKDGVTVTLSGDTFSVNGTGGTSNNNFFNLYYSPNTVLIPTGTWVFVLFGTGLDNIRVEVSDNVSPDVQKGAYGENPFICTVPAGITQSYFRICTKAGASFTDTSFKIMICSKAAWDVSHSYQPYGPTNAELQETKQDKLSSVDRDIIRALVYGNGFDLAPTSENQVDLNNITTPGKYRIQSAAETDYVTNKPERRAAGIVVEVASSTGYIRQKWLPSLSANEADYFCCRHYRSSGSGAANGWSPWYKYEGTLIT